MVRPLGGFVLGPLGDRIGRKRILVITILLMTVRTTMTGLIPGYSSIGVWAPILLLFARIFQGLSTGEFVGAMTYLVERAPDHKRGRMVGWRIPLLLGAPFGVFALYLRLRIEESPAYAQVSSSADAPVDPPSIHAGSRGQAAAGVCAFGRTRGRRAGRRLAAEGLSSSAHLFATHKRLRRHAGTRRSGLCLAGS